MDKKTILKILTVGLYAAPFTIFLFVQKTLYPMVTLKFLSLYVVIELLFVAWLWLILWYPEYRPRKSMILASLLILLNILTITSLVGINPSRSFWSTPDRMTGLFTLWHFFAYFLMLYSLRKELNWQKYFKVLFGVSLVVALFVLVQKFFPGFFLSGEASRPGSFMGNPALLAGYLLFNVFLGGWLATVSSGKERWLYAAGAAYEIVAIFLGSTRGALFGLAAGVAVLLIMLAWKKSKPAKIALIALALFAGLLLVTRSAAFWQRIPGLDRITSISTLEGSVGDRLIVWKIAGKSFSDNPIFGNGWENFKYTFDTNYDPMLFRSGLSETFWDRPHNIFLEHLANGGLLGLLAYLGVFVAAFYVIFKKVKPEFSPYAAGLFVAYLVQNSVVFDSFGTYLMFFVLLAFLAHSEDEHESSLPTSQTHPALRVGLMAVGGVIVIACLITNVKILYANNKEYWGINYMTQKYVKEGIDSFKKAVAVNQPYVNDIRLKQLQMLTRVSAVAPIPDGGENIRFALNELKKAQTTDPFNYYLYYTEADSKIVFRNLTLQYYKDADVAIRKADALSPNRQQNLYVLAKVRFLFGDVPGSLRVIERAVNLDPLAADPHYYYGLLLINSNNKERGVAEFMRAAELNYRPKDSVEARELGDALGDAENYDKAIYYYQKAIGFDSNDVDAHLKIGLIYMFKGESVSAKPYFQEVLRLMPDVKSSPDFAPFKPYFDSVGL